VDYAREITLEEVERRYSKLVWRICNRWTAASEDPEDYWSYGLIEIWNKQKEYDPSRGSHPVWATVVATSKIRHMLLTERKYKARFFEYDSVPWNDKMEVLHDTKNYLEESVLRTDVYNRLWDAVDKLKVTRTNRPIKTRQPEVLRRIYINEESGTDIAKDLGLTKSVISMTHITALKRLRANLELMELI